MHNQRSKILSLFDPENSQQSILDPVKFKTTDHQAFGDLCVFFNSQTENLMIIDTVQNSIRTQSNLKHFSKRRENHTFTLKLIPSFAIRGETWTHPIVVKRNASLPLNWSVSQKGCHLMVLK